MILPIGDGAPNYRESPSAPYEYQSALSPMHISSVGGLPEVVAPIGGIPYKSTLTDRIEPLPIAVSVVGALGEEMTLLEVVRMAMEHGGFPTKVATGRSIFGTSVAHRHGILFGGA